MKRKWNIIPIVIGIGFFFVLGSCEKIELQGPYTNVTENADSDGIAYKQNQSATYDYYAGAPLFGPNSVVLAEAGNDE